MGTEVPHGHRNRCWEVAVVVVDEAVPVDECVVAEAVPVEVFLVEVEVVVAEAEVAVVESALVVVEVVFEVALVEVALVVGVEFGVVADVALAGEEVGL